MIKILAAAAGMLSVATGGAYAANKACASEVCSLFDTNYIEYDMAANCSRTAYTCYGENKVKSCTKCPDGYTKKTKNTGTLTGCLNAASYDTCEENCNGCSNCASDTAWSAAATGYEKKTTRTCNCNTCNATTAYRCAAGYYGSSTNGTSGCTRCPSSGGVYGTSAAGSTTITACYIPANTAMTDGSGTYTFTSACYYTN